jgi:hypothetical protein
MSVSIRIHILLDDLEERIHPDDEESLQQIDEIRELVTNIEEEC